MKIIWKVSYRCKFPALGPQRTAKFVIRKHMFQNSLHVYVHSVQIAVAHWTAQNSREWHHPVSWERTPSIWSQMPGEVHELQPWLGILFRNLSTTKVKTQNLTPTSPSNYIHISKWLKSQKNHRGGLDWQVLLIHSTYQVGSVNNNNKKLK